MSNSLVLGSTAAILLVVAMAASQGQQPDKVKESLLAVQVAGNIVENYANEHFMLPAPTQGLVAMSSLPAVVKPADSHGLGKKDAWGRDLLFWADNFNYMIVSFGADGQPDYNYGQVPPYAGIPPGINDDVNQDIVLVNGSVLRGPLGQRRDPRKSMTDMRSIGTACEQYAIDNNFYPNSASTVVPVDFLVSHLEPHYIRSLPRQDAWQKPYLYWSSSQFYVIISTGADGTADFPYQEWSADEFRDYQGGQRLDLSQDIIFEQGQFIQWPVGIQT